MAEQKHNIGQFFIQIDGQDAPLDVMSQLDDAVVEDDLAQPAMFMLRFNDSSLKLTDGDLFRLGREVKLGASGADGKPGLILIGEITAVESALEQHNLTLTVRGYDRAHRLQRGLRTRTFLNQTDAEIVRQIAREAGLRAEVTGADVLHRYLIQHNQTDLEFLRERAQALGCRVTVVDKRLLFQPVEHAPSEAPALDYGVNLLSFRARLSAAAQPSSVEVRGWDSGAKRAIVGKATRPTRTPKINDGATAAQAAERAFGNPAALVVGDRPIASQDEAERRATAILDHVSGEYFAAEGRCLGMTQLRAGCLVTVKNVGNRFSGQYFISATRHEYTAAGGYVTSFYVTGRRPHGLLEQVRPGGAAHAARAAVAIGVVTNVGDPDKLGRVRLKFPWLDDQHESDWARLALPWAGPGRGIFASLEVDDEVLVAFEHGDINRPYVIGALWNGKDQPPGAAVKDGRKLALIQTAGGQTLALDDAAKQITISTGDQVITLDRQGKQLSVTAGAAKLAIDTGSGAVSMETSGTLTLKAAGGSLEIGASGIELKSSGTLKVDASAMLELTSSAIVNVRGSLIKINS